MTQKILPSFWYTKDAEAAARFYVSIFPDSRIDRVATMPAASPSGPADSVVLVDFTLMGMQFFAMAAGPLDPFNHAISFTVKCDSQAEIDKFYGALLAGGEEEQCGWVKDRYGVRWQIVPAQMNDWIAGPDRAKSLRVSEAMMKMKKLDLTALQKAADAK